MMKVELSREELALESVELLPDRDTMQLIFGSGFASGSNHSEVQQTNTNSGDAYDGDITQTNEATVTQTNTSTASGMGSFELNL